MRRAFAVFAGLAASVTLAPGAAPAAPPPGPTVGAVRFIGLADEALALRLAGEVTVRPGQPLLIEEIDYSAKLLALRPEIDSVSVRLLPAVGNRRDVEFTVHRVRLIDGIEWRRLGRIRAGLDRVEALVEQVRLPMRENAAAVSEVATSIEEALREEGHREATVEAVVLPVERWRATLELRIRPGPLWRVLDTEWTDVPQGAPRPPEIRLLPWNTLALQRTVDRWLTELREAGWRDATAEFACEPQQVVWAVCRVRVQAGPRSMFRFIGNRSFFDPDLAEALALEPTRRYTGAELARQARRLEQFYVRNGHHFARVTGETRLDGEAQTIVFHIDEGESRAFRRIDLVGVPEELVEELKDGMAITPLPRKELLYGKSRDLLSEAREEDTRRVLYALQRKGYLEARILSEQVLPEEPGLAVWRIEVDPGRQVRWAALELPDGADWGIALDLPEGLEAGEPADPFALRELADQVITRLRDAGYLDVQVESSYAPDPEKRGVVGRIRVDAGPRYEVAAVVVRGNRRARTSAILNSLPLRRGDSADFGRLFEGRRRLLERRVFQQVQAAWVLRDPALGRAVALYDVVERNGGEVEAGLLLTTGEGIGFDLRLAHYRLFGGFRNLRIEGSATFRPEDAASKNFLTQPFRSRLSLRYREPFPNRIPLTGQIQALDEISRNDPDYDWEARNVAVGIAWGPSLNAEINVDYLFEWFTRFNVIYPGYDPPGTDRIGSLRASGFLSRFDDRFDPREGWGTFHEAQWAAPWFGGDFGFLRYEGSLRGLVPIVGRFSLWMGGRAGAIVGAADRDEVPRVKRFRLGGPSSVRGYLREAVSPWVPLPNGEVLAIGGRDFVSLQSELRIGLWQDFELAVFSDTAHVRGWGGDAATASGWGGGLLYHTPAGPLRLDYGRKLITIPTDDAVYAIHFYIFASL